MDTSNESSAEIHAHILDSQEPESTCPLSPYSPKTSPIDMESHEIPLTINKFKIDKNFKNTKILSRSSISTRSITDKLDEQLEIISKTIL